MAQRLVIDLKPDVDIDVVNEIIARFALMGVGVRHERYTEDGWR